MLPISVPAQDRSPPPPTQFYPKATKISKLRRATAVPKLWNFRTRCQEAGTRGLNDMRKAMRLPLFRPVELFKNRVSTTLGETILRPAGLVVSISASCAGGRGFDPCPGHLVSMVERLSPEHVKNLICFSWLKWGILGVFRHTNWKSGFGPIQIYISKIRRPSKLKFLWKKPKSGTCVFFFYKKKKTYLVRHFPRTEPGRTFEIFENVSKFSKISLSLKISIFRNFRKFRLAWKLRFFEIFENFA